MAPEPTQHLAQTLLPPRLLCGDGYQAYERRDSSFSSSRVWYWCRASCGSSAATAIPVSLRALVFSITHISGVVIL